MHPTFNNKLQKIETYLTDDFLVSLLIRSIQDVSKKFVQNNKTLGQMFETKI